MLRKLTLGGPPNKLEADCLLTALRVASFHVPVVTFRTEVPLSKVDANDLEPLLSVVEELLFVGRCSTMSLYVLFIPIPHCRFRPVT